MLAPAPDVAPDVRIDIWSDVICPWCFLGKRRLDLALVELGWDDSDVEIHWRAYQLDPRATAEPGDLRQGIERKYGPGAFDAMVDRLTGLGEADGIDYRFDIAQRVSTVDAHRLLAWAWDVGGAAIQGALSERLFLAYFTEGVNVADRDRLVEMAAEIGLDGAAATEVLTSGAFADEVVADLQGAVDRDLTGVPAFVVEDRLLIPGAQDVDTLVRVLRRARERLVPEALTADGEVCAVDDPVC